MLMILINRIFADFTTSCLSVHQHIVSFSLLSSRELDLGRGGGSDLVGAISLPVSRLGQAEVTLGCVYSRVGAQQCLALSEEAPGHQAGC